MFVSVSDPIGSGFGVDDYGEAMREVIAGAVIEAHAPILPGNNPKAIVLDFVQPLTPRSAWPEPFSVGMYVRTPRHTGRHWNHHSVPESPNHAQNHCVSQRL
jgi:hypothetical protein